MGEARVEVSKELDFPAVDVYALIADYETHHPRILPKPYFRELQVLSGGQGAGTRVHVQMRVLGIARDFQMTIAEPEPGRVLTETDEESETITSFIIEPLNGRSSRVTIATRYKTGEGPAGWIEKVVTKTITRRIYKQELQLLERYLGKSR